MHHLIAPVDSNQVYTGYLPYIQKKEWEKFSQFDEENIIQMFIDSETSSVPCGSRLSMWIGTKVFQSNGIYRK